MLAAMRAGARGYLLKGADESEITARAPRSPPAERCSGPTSPPEYSPASAPARGATSRPFPELSDREPTSSTSSPAGCPTSRSPPQLHLSAQDRAQLRLVDLHQARRGRPCRRHHPSSRGRPRPRRATLNLRRQFESACHSPALNPSHAHSRSRVGSNVVRNRVTWCGSGCLMREQITLLLLVEAVVRWPLRWRCVGDPAAG